MALRLIEKQVSGGNQARVMYNSDCGEYVVKFYVNGQHYEPADYFTGDKDDAKGTARQELLNMH